MAFENEPLLEEFEKRPVNLNREKLSRIWRPRPINDIPPREPGNLPPQINSLKPAQVDKINRRFEDAQANHRIIIVHYGDLAYVADSQESAYYELDQKDVTGVLNGLRSDLQVTAIAGNPQTALISFGKSAHLNFTFERKTFPKFLFGPEMPNEIPAIYILDPTNNSTELIFSMNPYRKSSLYLDKSVAQMEN